MTLEAVALALGTLVGLLGFVLEWRRRGVDRLELEALGARASDLEARLAQAEVELADLRAWRDRVHRAA